MIFTYKPEGGEVQTWRITTGRLLSPEMEAIERVTETFYPQWNQSLLNGSVSAARALLWVLRKRENPTLKYDEVQFTYDEFDLEYDLDEKAAIVADYDAAMAAGAPEPSPAFAALIEEYRAELPSPEPEEVVDLDAVEDPESHQVEAPKAPSVEKPSEHVMSGSLLDTSRPLRLTGTD